MHRWVGNLFLNLKPEVMQDLIVEKHTEEQKAENTRILNSFLMAMTNQDFVLMETLLHNNGRYIGRKTKWIFMAWLRKKFEVLRGKSVLHDIDTFHSMEYYPGNLGVCITYSEFDSETCDTGETLLEIKLIARVKEGKIIAVQQCSKMLERDQIERLITNN